jgi:hypothetical protein
LPAVTVDFGPSMTRTPPPGSPRLIAHSLIVRTARSSRSFGENFCGCGRWRYASAGTPCFGGNTHDQTIGVPAATSPPRLRIRNSNEQPPSFWTRLPTPSTTASKRRTISGSRAMSRRAIDGASSARIASWSPRASSHERWRKNANRFAENAWASATNRPSSSLT